MTSAALQDLSNRIASNTLTGAQQTLLVGALAELIPAFPSPDEISNSIIDERFARAWLAPLYTLQAIAGGSAVLPTQQTAWFVNALTGNDANDGASSSTPVQHIAEIATRLRGVSGGGRPTLIPATGNTVTVHLLSAIPASDPLAPILDVDLDSTGANPVNLIILGAAGTPSHSGTLATASAFARTNAGGQIKVTDATVVDYGPSVGVHSLFTDTTSGAVAWLYGPDVGASATGTLSIGYSAQTAGVPPLQTQTAIAGADAYTLADPVHASLGTGFVTRGFPQQSSNVSGTIASVFFYRVHLVQPSNADPVTLQPINAIYVFQESQIDHPVVATQGQAVFANCLSFHNSGIRSSGSAIVQCVDGGVISGGNTGTLTASQGGTCLVDTDFAVFSATPYIATQAGEMLIGQASFWVQGAGNHAIDAGGGGLVEYTRITAATTVFYGADGGTPIAISGAIGNGQILYSNSGSGHPAADQFQFNHSTFLLGDLTSAFGFNATTGATVGPTTNTLAHLDAALGAGTGFGGQAIDPSTGSYLRLAA